MFVQWKLLQLLFVQCLQLIINVQREAAAEIDFCFNEYLEGEICFFYGLLLESLSKTTGHDNADVYSDNYCSSSDYLTYSEFGVYGTWLHVFSF